MRKTLAALAVAALTLAGCGTTGEDEATITNTPQASAEDNGYQLEKLAIGDSAHLTNSVNGPRDVNVTVTDVVISTECNDRPADYTGIDPEGGYYVQVSMDVDVVAEQMPFGAPQFTFAKEGGEVLDATPARDCTRDFQNNLFHPGQSGNFIDEYWMPEVPAGAVLSIPGEPVTYAWMLDGVKVAEAPAGDGSTRSEPAANNSSAPPAEEESTNAESNNGGLVEGIHGDSLKPPEWYGDPNAPGVVTQEDLDNGFEPAGDYIIVDSKPSTNYEGWSCNGPAYLCRDDNASGKTEGHGGY